MHGTEHAAPSRASWQMGERFTNTRQPRPEGAFRVVVAALRFYRPINQEWPPHYGIAVHKSPVTAVLAVIAIVTHREILSRRNNKFIPLDVLADLRLPFLDGVGGHHLSARGRKRVVEGVSKHR